MERTPIDIEVTTVTKSAASLCNPRYILLLADSLNKIICAADDVFIKEIGKVTKGEFLARGDYFRTRAAELAAMRRMSSELCHVMHGVWSRSVLTRPLCVLDLH